MINTYNYISNFFSRLLRRCMLIFETCLWHSWILPNQNRIPLNEIWNTWSITTEQKETPTQNSFQILGEVYHSLPWGISRKNQEQTREKQQLLQLILGCNKCQLVTRYKVHVPRLTQLILGCSKCQLCYCVYSIVYECLN